MLVAVCTFRMDCIWAAHIGEKKKCFTFTILGSTFGWFCCSAWKNYYYYYYYKFSMGRSFLTFSLHSHPTFPHSYDLPALIWNFIQSMFRMDQNLYTKLIKE